MQPKKSILKPRWFVVGIVVIVAVGGFVLLRRHEMPRVAWNALSGADQYELLSLDPNLSLDPSPSKSDFYGHEILGRTIIRDAVVRDRLNDALQTGVRESDGTQMACFNPRHGIRVTHAGVTTDFVICFECRQVEVRRGAQKIAFFLVSRSPHAVFDEALKSAGIPLAPKEP